MNIAYFGKLKYEDQYSPNKGIIGGLLSKSMVYHDEDEADYYK